MFGTHDQKLISTFCGTAVGAVVLVAAAGAVVACWTGAVVGATVVAVVQAVNTRAATTVRKTSVLFIIFSFCMLNDPREMYPRRVFVIVEERAVFILSETWGFLHFSEITKSPKFLGFVQ
jgi:hypothetical protein